MEGYFLSTVRTSGVVAEKRCKSRAPPRGQPHPDHNKKATLRATLLNWTTTRDYAPINSKHHWPEVKTSLSYVGQFVGVRVAVPSRHVREAGGQEIALNQRSSCGIPKSVDFLERHAGQEPDYSEPSAPFVPGLHRTCNRKSRELL